MEFFLIGGTAIGVFGFIYKKYSRMRLKSKHRSKLSQLSQLSLQDSQQPVSDHPSLQLASGALPRSQILDWDYDLPSTSEQQPTSVPMLSSRLPPPLPTRRVVPLLENGPPVRSQLSDAIASQKAALAQVRY
jgi:hypothetical protein